MTTGTTPRVLNVKTFKRSRYPDAVRVHRPSIWGNPFVIGRHGTREEVIAKYREYLLKRPELLARLPELRGRDLICFCAPERCHAEVLLELANPQEEDDW